MVKDGDVENSEAVEKGGVLEKGGESGAEQSAVELSVSELPTADDEAEPAAMHVCEVCGMCFETRRGLSSHARSHLRQMGVCVSESSGAPISLLYELITERDGALPFTPKDTHVTTAKHTTHTHHKVKHATKHKAKHGSGTKLKIKIGKLVKRKRVPVPVPESLRDFSSTSSSSSSSSPMHHSKPLKPTKTPPALPALPKPLRAPQETDTRLDLLDMSGESQHDCVYVCELCGAWYETKKGLACHARAHLRHFGVELDPKALPIQVLHELLQKEAGLLGQDSPTALLTPPPPKKRKPSPAKEKTQRDGDSAKTANCEFCGENFKSTQSLASHARSHLRQLGVTDWTAHGSPMATLRELMARRNCSSLPRPTQTTASTPAQTKPPPVATPLPSPGPSPSRLPKPQSEALPLSLPGPSPSRLPKPQSEALPLSLPGPSPSRLPKPQSEALPLSLPGPSPSRLPKPQSEALPLTLPGPTPFRVPKARKGSRLAVPKLKDEPVELDISTEHLTPPPPVQPAADRTTVPTNQNLITRPQVEVGVSEPVRCDYCGDLFDSRKALSCHARAHLRQLGVKWAPCASPIDTLHDLMIREGRGQGSEDTPSPVDLGKEKTETDGTASVCEATCELCGFDFENRKALASHARAHLRQQGEQWTSSQSPIAALSQWMSREPEKVAALHQLYMQGTLPQVRKRRVCSSVGSSDADSARSGVSRPSPAARQGKTGASLSCSSSSHRKLSSHRPTLSAVNHGTDHRLPKTLRMERVHSLKRMGNVPSLVPRPPETSLVKLVGKIYSLKCRFCEQVFSGPLSVQEDWLIHLQHHILNLKPDHAHSSAPTLPHSESSQLIGQTV